jgi:hypothetical protein
LKSSPIMFTHPPWISTDIYETPVYMVI